MLEARAEALYGAWLAGTALAAVGMALHHKLCHVLGGTFDLPHAEVHTIVLPHATAYNRAGAPAAMARIAQALGAEDAAEGLFDLAAALGARQSLAEIGLRASDLERAADLAVESPYPEPDPAHPRRHPRAARRRVPRPPAGGLSTTALPLRDRHFVLGDVGPSMLPACTKYISSSAARWLLMVATWCYPNTSALPRVACAARTELEVNRSVRSGRHGSSSLRAYRSWSRIFLRIFPVYDSELLELTIHDLSDYD